MLTHEFGFDDKYGRFAPREGCESSHLAVEARLGHMMLYSILRIESYLSDFRVDPILRFPKLTLI